MYGVRERERCVWSEGESCVYGVRERERCVWSEGEREVCME